MQFRETVSKTIQAHAEGLTEVSQYIFDNPELCYKEFKAHDKLTGYLDSLGFKVERHFKDIETSFRVVYQNGEGGPTWGLNSEYDALNDYGHACGWEFVFDC